MSVHRSASWLSCEIQDHDAALDVCHRGHGAYPIPFSCSVFSVHKQIGKCKKSDAASRVALSVRGQHAVGYVRRRILAAT